MISYYKYITFNKSNDIFIFCYKKFNLTIYKQKYKTNNIINCL